MLRAPPHIHSALGWESRSFSGLGSPDSKQLEYQVTQCMATLSRTVVTRNNVSLLLGEYTSSFGSINVIIIHFSLLPFAKNCTMAPWAMGIWLQGIGCSVSVVFSSRGYNVCPSMVILDHIENEFHTLKNEYKGVLRLRFIF